MEPSMWVKKLHRFIFAITSSSFAIICDTRVSEEIFYHKHILYSLYIRKQGTSLRFIFIYF